MWRARVEQVAAPGWITVSIPKLFGTDSLVGPVQSAVDAQVGDQVVIADLTPQARVRDWWVVGYESRVGEWGTPYPHAHPVSEVTGLGDALTGKADAPGPWVKVGLEVGWADGAGGAADPGVGTSQGLWARRSTTGLHLRMWAQPTTATGYPTGVAYLPEGLRPAWSATVPGLAEVSSSWQPAGIAVSATTGRVALSFWDTATSLTGVSLTTILAVP